MSNNLTNILADSHPITVALYFRASDVPALWDLASRHHFDDDELSMFAKAARATERALPIVVECTAKWQLDELSAFFPKHGIQPPRIEELRI